MSEPPIAIGFVLCPGMLATGTALPYEMWLAAGDYQRARHPPGRALALHRIAAGPVADGYGRLALNADCALADAPPVDVVYLPALWRNPRLARAAGTVLSPWLRAQHARGATIAAVSSGVRLLAASGLLDGRAATTHWYQFDRFERDFPRVMLKRQFFITQSGTLYCAASINSLADVSVNLIERAWDRATARHVERNFSHEIRRTYEEYRYLDGGSTPLDDELVVEAQMWIADNLAREATVATLAAHVGVSARTLERRFRLALGSGPRRYWQQQRLHLAKELLAQTNLTIAEIAARVGYQDAGYFARLFQRDLSVAPHAYRETVRAKLFRAAPDRAGVKRVDTSLSGPK